jgi:hypothetical protein
VEIEIVTGGGGDWWGCGILGWPWVGGGGGSGGTCSIGRGTMVFGALSSMAGSGRKRLRKGK